MHPIRVVAAAAATLAIAVAAGLLVVGAANADVAATPSLASRSAVVMDAATGRVLYAKAAHARGAMASCTKIMTALLAIQRLPPDRMLVVPKAVRGPMGATLGLRPGQHISAENAVIAMIVASRNDAALTLASAVSGSEAKFVRLMNQSARSWGMRDTHYDDCAGWEIDARHFTSAYDLALLARRAMQEPRYADIAGLRAAVVTWSPGRSSTIVNGNDLLEYAWADGVKAGVTSQAHYCLAASGQPGLRRLITATLGAPTRPQMVTDGLALFDYGSSLFAQRQIAGAGDGLGTMTADDGASFPVVAGATVTAVVRSAATVEHWCAPAVPLPVMPEPGAVVGTATFRADGVTVGTCDLLEPHP